MLHLLPLAFAAPVDDAIAALDAHGPHTALYDKRSTGEPVLEVAYIGPREGIVRVVSPDGAFVIAVDASSIYTRVDEQTCARLDARTIFEQARFGEALGLEKSAGPPGSQLIYRATPDGEIQVAGSFAQEPNPPLFSWHDDLGGNDVEVKVEKKAWEATSPVNRWVVSRKTGLLTEMTVGEDALELADVRKEPPPAASTVCPKTTDPMMGKVMTAQLRLVAALPSQIDVATAWPELSPDQRALAQKHQAEWWRLYFQDELPGWVSGIQEGDWRKVLLQNVSDEGQFAAFVAQLPEADRPSAVQRWQQYWYAEFGGQMARAHLLEVRDQVLARLGQAQVTWTPEVQHELLMAPMEQALMVEAEQPLQGLLVPLLGAGSAQLKAP